VRKEAKQNQKKKSHELRCGGGGALVVLVLVGELRRGVEVAAAL
jgi:hypothetical protein